jgi:hypothetical protein
MRLRALLISIIIPYLGIAQDTTSVELERYTNASLGFSIDLPCKPEEVSADPDIVLTCERPPFSIMISGTGTRVKDDLEFDARVSSLLTGDLERMSIQGRMARRKQVIEGDRQWEILFVSTDDQVLLFSFGSSTDTPFDPRMLRSLLLH